MDLLVTATLLSAMLIAFGGVALLRPRPQEKPAESPAPAPQNALADDPAASKPAALAHLKDLVEARDWGRALPSLLIIAGLLGVMLFGSLSLLFVFGQKTAGVASLGVSLYATIRLAYDYARA